MKTEPTDRQMNKLEIHSAQHKGDLQKECLWLKVLEDISRLDFYLVSDTTYNLNDSISNELRHVYWFPNKAVKKGDWVKLLTKSGSNTETSNDSGTRTHHFHWGLGRTVWNKGQDTAVLFKVESWKSKNV